ncbi:MAG: adenylyltransferase/cytidyltransferase family protein, partial [Nitrospinae bacterium]|nr:adenylyltransferase/cytidyltransferase family protein [Nitrospinota bacterium]
MSNNKIFPIKKLGEIAEELRNEGKSIAYCHGEFDLLHFGHMRHYKQAKSQADILMVTLTPDKFINKGPGRPVYNENFRAEYIAELECVDYVGVNEWTTAENALKTIKPNVYCKGNEYLKKEDVTGRITIEKNLVESLGGRMFFTDDVVFSSSKLSKNHFSVFPKEAMSFLHEFGKEYDNSLVIEKLKELKKLKVLVLGDSYLKETIATHKGDAFECPLEKSHQAIGAIETANQLAQFVEDVTCLNINNNVEIDDYFDNRVKLITINIGDETGLPLKKLNYITSDGQNSQRNDTELTPEKPLSIIDAFKGDSFNLQGFDIVFIDTYNNSEEINEVIHE